MKKLMMSVLSFLLCVIMQAEAQTYKVDPAHTAVTTKVLRFGVVNVVGRFNQVSGSITFNPSDLGATEGELVIVTDSYTANNTEGENAVKGPPFLDVKTYPEMKFQVTKLTKSGTGYVVEGSLTLHGTTKSISFPVTINGPFVDPPTGKQSIGISGALTINRQDYGVKMARKLPDGRDLVGNDVAIEINLLAIAQ
jgi:polyisoprenoid-binding protein YceI